MSKDSRPVLDVLRRIVRPGTRPHLRPVLVRIDLRVSKNQVNTRVIRNVLANRQVDPILLLWEVRTRRRMALHNVEHVLWPDTTLKEKPRRTEGARGEDDTPFLGEWDEPAWSDVGVVGLHTGDLGAVADDVLDYGVGAVEEVRAGDGGLVVGCDRACTFAIDKLVKGSVSRLPRSERGEEHTENAL